MSYQLLNKTHLSKWNPLRTAASGIFSFLDTLTMFIHFYLLKITFSPGQSFKQHLISQKVPAPLPPHLLLFLLRNLNSPKKVVVIEELRGTITLLWEAVHSCWWQIVILCSSSVDVPSSPLQQMPSCCSDQLMWRVFLTIEFPVLQLCKAWCMNYCNSLGRANFQGHWCSLDFCLFVVSWLFLLLIQKDFSCCCCPQRSRNHPYPLQHQGGGALSKWGTSGGSCVTSPSRPLYSGRMQV